ncbi:FAD-dependent oxidoreductase [Pseudooceanicola sp.]|uniref:FAD-dependent oxidoreductase n=1 Tax=Pseudooceanicola sp. TaxID=1914328 RepID=UPI004059FB1A
MTEHKRRILIVGAGIAGLAAARALALRGADVTVLEQAAEIAEIGAGLQVSPNGLAVLAGLGLDQALRDTGAVLAEGIALRNSAGRLVTRLELSGPQGAGDYLLVHRADLIAVLAEGARAAGARIRPLHLVARIEPGATPSIVTHQGTMLTADLVLAADGIHSSLAATLNPGSAPRFTGHVAWRATVPEEAKDRDREKANAGDRNVQIFMGAGRHLVTYPLRGGTLRNIVAVEERATWVPESWSHTDDPANLRRAFSGMGPQVRALTNRVTQTHLWGLFRHPVATRWSGERVVLLGDAAHPTLPFMGQGANMALEDAWVLADALYREGNMATALARYQTLRHRRVVRAVRTANGNAWKYHLRRPFSDVAHLGLRVLGAKAPGLLTNGFDWLYNHDVTQGARLVEG